ncbi:MAG TPA: DUF2330 domain-containing protein [Haliangium sp.]|nr:DUF2330 domain-containing protein [Haliangium sp.]
MIKTGVSLRLAVAGAFALLLLARPEHTPVAHACGCFAPPNPSVPVVQSGERILFAMEEGVVTAHIQIQYSGDPEEFAWLVPMPAIPELELGTDEIFQLLFQSTQPQYQLGYDFPDDCGGSDFSCGQSLGDAAGGEPPPNGPGDDGPLVAYDAIGPYETAVLEASDKQPMLDWLSTNGFFVPAGTDEAVTPYIRPGGYFLALKLRKGLNAGDLQPIVVKYQSELPQIPIVLTSVAADPDMPVLVWVFGEHRAIPRNYFHAHVNDARINWLDGGSNYFDVVGEALDEAEGHHAFITEYAGTTEFMRGRLDYPDRFGNLEQLRTSLPDPRLYLQNLQFGGFIDPSSYSYSSQMLTILGRHLPIPPEVLEGESAVGLTVDPQFFYLNFELYQMRYPDILDDAYPDFDPAALTAELEERVVVPTLAAGALFQDNPYLTRLFSMLSPEEMTKDPVFSFNPDLPDVSNYHGGTIKLSDCSGSGPATLVTEQGWKLYLPEGTTPTAWPEAPQPASLLIEMLREEGAAQVVTDNTDEIDQVVDELGPPPSSDGCAIDGPGPRATGTRAGRGMAALLLLFGLAVVLSRGRWSRT